MLHPQAGRKMSIRCRSGCLRRALANPLKELLTNTAFAAIFPVPRCAAVAGSASHAGLALALAGVDVALAAQGRLSAFARLATLIKTQKYPVTNILSLKSSIYHLTRGVLQLSAQDFLEFFRTARKRYGKIPNPQTCCQNSFLLP